MNGFLNQLAGWNPLAAMGRDVRPQPMQELMMLMQREEFMGARCHQFQEPSFQVQTEQFYESHTQNMDNKDVDYEFRVWRENGEVMCTADVRRVI